MSLLGSRSQVSADDNPHMSFLCKKHEVEGYKNRTIRLYHVTSPDSAKAIVNSYKMLRGSTGLFGGGIYFAETEAIASHKAHNQEPL